MPVLDELLYRNKQWAANRLRQDPDFFSRLSAQQTPDYLWIGCSDSRVPATEIVGLDPGEMFVHRNIGNVVIHTDFNCLSVMQFAIDVLRVKHIIVCGHYGCGAIRAAMSQLSYGFVDNWLRHIKEIIVKYEAELVPLDEDARLRRLCELNVIEQVKNLGKSKAVQRAWDAGHPLQLHGWIYGIADGIIHDLDIHLHNREQIPSIFHMLGKSDA
ncbi:MAG: carbonate dehydratase [Hahellaceae bacterium]|nr:carbonate dehydratase [Hahellaceae bacterium]